MVGIENATQNKAVLSISRTLSKVTVTENPLNIEVLKNSKQSFV